MAIEETLPSTLQCSRRPLVGRHAQDRPVRCGKALSAIGENSRSLTQNSTVQVAGAPTFLHADLLPLIPLVVSEVLASNAMDAARTES